MDPKATNTVEYRKIGLQYIHSKEKYEKKTEK